MPHPSDTPPQVKTVDVEIKAQSSVFGKLRAYFFTGLVITAPIAITIWATYWFVTLFDSWIKPFLPASYNPDTYLPIRVPGFGLIFALLAITLIGFMAANLAGRTMIAIWDKILNSTPVVRSIYKGSKQIFETLFSQKGTSFRYVCLVEWPRRGTWSLAFISRDVDGAQIGLEPGRAMYAVYMSTTPNPTSGYVFFVDIADVKIIDMSVEDGLKLVISMGLVFPDKPLPPEKEAAAAVSLPTEA
ncbi:MAG: DUF502 domain-containing protein [Alphaproteobacteria bacterium]|uniref:DUF502 domain-containing protein n=1 Tax=Aestuariivirga sp. TaxID=2650926 RepID=UPI00301B6302|nr:DUF502 domain-containing protein [Alphaproteobacteria bacterium]